MLQYYSRRRFEKERLNIYYVHTEHIARETVQVNGIRETMHGKRHTEKSLTFFILSYGMSDEFWSFLKSHSRERWVSEVYTFPSESETISLSEKAYLNHVSHCASCPLLAVNLTQHGWSNIFWQHHRYHFWSVEIYHKSSRSQKIWGYRLR